MAVWTCPSCDRQFGKINQSHLCAPGISIAAYFADRPPVQRLICDAVLDHLETLGPVIVDPVDVGILIKRVRTFAELRAKRDRVALSMILPRTVHDPRIARRIAVSGPRVAHFVNLVVVEDVDDQLREWLAESYFET